MTNRSNRPSVPKSVRFEVFKRDSFKCQYCGATAPEALLQIDHIKPIVKGGTNDLTNIITSCAPCNSGKKDRSLDDKTVIAKSRIQLEELQARREQLEMMMEWREGLRDMQEDAVDRVCSYWEELAPGWVINEHGKANLRKWIRKFSIDEVLSAMDTAAAQYLQLDRSGKCTSDSWEMGFSKIPGISRVEREGKKDPTLKEIYYIRGILRKRLSYFDEGRALQWLKAARSWDVSVDELREIALEVRSWTQFGNAIDDVISRQRKIFGEEHNPEE